MESRRLLSSGPGAIVTEGDQFGLVDGQNLILAQTDIDGDTIFYRLTGGGTGTVVDGSLELTGTTNTSALAVIVRRGSGGDGLATLSGITADGPMRSISAAAVTVAGDITLNGGAAPGTPSTGTVGMRLSQIEGGSIDTGGEAISLLILQNWADSPGITQQVIAPWIGNLSVTGRADNRRTALDETLAGDMDAALVLSDAGPGGFSLRIGTVAGTADSIAAPGNIGNITAGALAGDIVANAIGSVTTRASRRAGGPTGSATGSIVATGLPTQQGRAVINTVRITGDATDLTVRSDQGSLGNVTIVGNATNVQVLSAGLIRTVTVGGMLGTGRIQSLGSVSAIRLGAMDNSSVLVGFAPEFTVAFATANTDFAAGADTLARLGIFVAGTTTRGPATPQITGENSVSAAQLGNVGIRDMEATLPTPSLQFFVLADAAGSSPRFVRYLDRATPENSFVWTRGQTQPELLQAMLHVL